MSLEREPNFTSATAPRGSCPDVLAAELFQMFRQRHTTRCALLLDPVLRDARIHLDRRRSEVGAQPDASVQVRLAPGLIDSSNWPILLEVDLTTFWGRQIIIETSAMALEDWDPVSLRQGNGHRICGWLVSQYPLPELASLLAPRLVNIRPNGQRCLIRFHDPSVAWQAWEILSPVQKGRLVEPADCWISVGPDGKPTTFFNAPDAVAGMPKEGIPSPDVVQWLRLDHIGPINRALARLATRPDRAAVRATSDTLIRAHSYGFEDPDDLSEFAWRALTVSPRFDLHATVAKRIASKLAGESFGYALRDVSETQWNEIAMDCEASTTQ